MSNFIVYSYHGFGDHCICYGIIRVIAALHDKVQYYSDYMSEDSFNTFKRLFSSLSNVELMPEPMINTNIKADHCIANTKAWFDQVKPWMDDPLLPAPEWFNESWIFDRQWYMNGNLPFNLKWDNFFFERDLKKEKEVYYDMLGLKDDEEFIFLHEDPARNYFINRKYINPSIKLIEFNKFPNINILDILYTVEKSKEMHVYNTGLLTFVDLMNIKHDNLNYHLYTRPWIFDRVALRLNWKVIE